MNEEIVVEKPSEIAGAWETYYNRLASAFRSKLHLFRQSTILEGGAGKGQLTIPLLRRLPVSTRYIAVDSSKGPYFDWLPQLANSLDGTKFRSRVQVLKEDVRRMRRVRSESVDAVVSNELLCDLPKEQQIADAFREFDRVLVNGGRMVHGEWSSVPQKDHGPFLVTHSPSWNPDQLHIQGLKAGFREMEIFYFSTSLVFKGEAAEKEVQSWAPTRHFLPKNRAILRSNGMRIPPEHVIVCRKPRSSKANHYRRR